MLLAIAGVAAQAAAQGKTIAPQRMEVAGVRTDMSKQQAINALKSFDAKLAIKRRHTATIGYSDGARHMNTPS